MADDLKSMLTKVLSNGGKKKFYFAYGAGKRKDGKGDGELAVSGKKPKKPQIEAVLAVCKEVVEGVCWNGAGPDDGDTIYFAGRGKKLSPMHVSKMRLTAKAIAGRQYDFELPSPEEEARASSLGEGDGQGPSAIDLQIEAIEQEIANLIQFLGSAPSPLAKKGAQLLETKLKDSEKEADDTRRLKLLQGLQTQGKQLLNVDEISKAAAQSHQQQLDDDEQQRQQQTEATTVLEQQIEALRQEIANLVQFMSETPSTAAQRGAQVIAAKLDACLKEADAAKCLKLLQALRAQAKQFQNADEVSKGAKDDRQAELNAAADLEQQISTIQLEIVKLVQALKSTPSSVAKRGAQVIDTKLTDCMKETDAGKRLKLLQALKAQAKQFQNADEVSKTAADEQATYDELAEFCMAWHGNTDVDRIADESYLLFNNKTQDGNDPNLLPKLQALKELAKEAIVTVIYNRLLKSDPRNAKKIADLKKKVLATSNLAEVHKHLENVRERLTNQKKDGTKKADEALGKVNQGDLENLSAEERIDLLSKLRLAIPDDENEQDQKEQELKPYFDAMATLYKAMPLQPEFANTQKTKRKDVLDALTNDPEVVKAHENWAAWSQDEDGKKKKLDALKHILTVQSQLMGFKSVPEILPETMDKFVFEDENGGKFEQFDQGNFSSKDRAIRVNDHPESTFSTNFYKSLITMLHENTHSYQNQLIDELKAGTLTEASNKEYYQQALLFLLNEDVGYLPPGDAYEEQPVERHAHEAEDEASEAFEKFAEPEVRDARRKCQELRDQIDKLIARAKTDGLKDLEKSLLQCQPTVQRAMRKDTAADILAGLAEAQRSLDSLKPAVDDLQIKVMREEAESLIQKMKTKKHPKLATIIDEWCATLSGLINKQGQKADIIKRNVAEYRDAAEKQLPAAAALIDEMEQWLKDDKHKEHKTSIEIYVKALQPRNARQLQDVLQRTRGQFDDKRREVESGNQ